jgi:hypothetical protein
MVLDIYNPFALESTVPELGIIAFCPVPDSLTNRSTPELLALPQYLSSHAETSLLSSVGFDGIKPLPFYALKGLQRGKRFAERDARKTEFR